MHEQKPCITGGKKQPIVILSAILSFNFVDFSDIEVRAQAAEARALQAEESLQNALEKIQDLERKLEDKPSLDSKGRSPPLCYITVHCIAITVADTFSLESKGK